MENQRDYEQGYRRDDGEPPHDVGHQSFQRELGIQLHREPADGDKDSAIKRYQSYPIGDLGASYLSGKPQFNPVLWNIRSLPLRRLYDTHSHLSFQCSLTIFWLLR